MIDELWSTAEIAEFAKMNRKHVAMRIVTQPDFPAPIRPTGGRGRWPKSEVLAWFESRRQAA